MQGYYFARFISADEYNKKFKIKKAKILILGFFDLSILF
jgi:hypothetical protein